MARWALRVIALVTTGAELWSTEPGGDMGAGVRVVDGWVLAPHGFWFFGAASDLPGGVVAYRLPERSG